MSARTLTDFSGHWQLPCLLAVQALAFVLLVAADPAEIHSAEILQPAAVAYEFNRGAISLDAMPLYLNGLITVWETLAFAGFFRLGGVSLVPLLTYAALIALLTTAAWHAVLHRAFGLRAARWGCLFLIAATPWWLALSTQFDSRHTTGNALLPLLLLGFLRWVLPGRRAGTLFFAAGAVFALVLTRGTWLHLGVLLFAAGRLLPRRALLPLAFGTACALLLRQIMPPAETVGGILRQYETPLWEMLCQQVAVSRMSRLLAAIVTVHLPQALGFPPAAATGYLLAIVGAFCLIARRAARSRVDAAHVTTRVLVLYPLCFLALLIFLDFSGHFHDDHAPAWFALRYLTSIVPVSAVALGVAAAALPTAARHGAWLLLLTALGWSLAGWHYCGRPLSEYRALNYRITGEIIGRNLSSGNITVWRERFARLSPAALPALVSGLGTAATVPELPPEHFLLAQSLVPPGCEAQFYRSAGYWAGYGPPARTERILRDFLPAENREEFLIGLAAPHTRCEWWPIYHAARGAYRGPFPVIVD